MERPLPTPAPGTPAPARVLKGGLPVPETPGGNLSQMIREADAVFASLGSPLDLVREDTPEPPPPAETIPPPDPSAPEALPPGPSEPAGPALPLESPESTEPALSPSAPEAAEPAPPPDAPEAAGPASPPDAPQPAEAAPEIPAEADVPPPPPKPPVPLSNETVTGHTAGLWKYLPIPEDQPDQAPEYRTLHRCGPGGEILAAQVRGKKHKHEGTNGDDWFEAAFFQDLVFLAVSDGAGSKKLSRIGAKAACQTAVGYLKAAFTGLWTPELAETLALDFGDQRCMSACASLAGVVQSAVGKARAAVESAFYQRAADPAWEALLGRSPELRDFSGTLLAAAVLPAGNAGRLVLSCQVGDGMIALVNTKAPFGEALKLMGAPDSGEFSGETEFLTSAQAVTPEALQSRTKISRGHSDVLLLMSDGVADDYFPHETGLLRLYCDLAANGILTQPVQDLTADQLQRYTGFPAPLSYPWVNDQSVQVPLHYTRRILESTGLTMEALWQDRTALTLAALALKDLPEDPAERLRHWLDNYVERGSFDDRTLAILRMG